MGVLVKGKDWAVTKAGRVSTAGGVVADDTVQRLRAAVQFISDSSPTFPNAFIGNSSQVVLQILNHISEYGAVSWSKERLYELYMMLYDTLSQLLAAVSPFITKPTKWVIDSLTLCLREIGAFIYVTFEKIDDNVVTPVVDGVAKVAIGTKNFTMGKVYYCNNTFVQPVTGFVGRTIVSPTCNTLKAAGSGVKSRGISVIAMIDNNLPLVKTLESVARYAKKVDHCVAAGRISNNIILPIGDGLKAVDTKVANGSFQDLISSSLDEFNQKRGTQQKKAPGATAVGPPVMKTRK